MSQVPENLKQVEEIQGPPIELAPTPEGAGKDEDTEKLISDSRLNANVGPTGEGLEVTPVPATSLVKNSEELDPADPSEVIESMKATRRIDDDADDVDAKSLAASLDDGRLKWDDSPFVGVCSVDEYNKRKAEHLTQALTDYPQEISPFGQDMPEGLANPEFMSGSRLEGKGLPDDLPSSFYAGKGYFGTNFCMRPEDKEKYYNAIRKEGGALNQIARVGAGVDDVACFIPHLIADGFKGYFLPNNPLASESTRFLDDLKSTPYKEHLQQSVVEPAQNFAQDYKDSSKYMDTYTGYYIWGEGTKEEAVQAWNKDIELVKKYTVDVVTGVVEAAKEDPNRTLGQMGIPGVGVSTRLFRNRQRSQQLNQDNPNGDDSKSGETETRQQDQSLDEAPKLTLDSPEVQDRAHGVVTRPVTTTDAPGSVYDPDGMGPNMPSGTKQGSVTGPFDTVETAYNAKILGQFHKVEGIVETSGAKPNPVYKPGDFGYKKTTSRSRQDGNPSYPSPDLLIDGKVFDSLATSPTSIKRRIAEKVSNNQANRFVVYVKNSDGQKRNFHDNYKSMINKLKRTEKVRQVIFIDPQTGAIRYWVNPNYKPHKVEQILELE